MILLPPALAARLAAVPTVPGAGVLLLPPELLHDHDATLGDDLAAALAADLEAALLRPVDPGPS